MEPGSLFVDDTEIERLVGGAAFGRGKAYARAGHVTEVQWAAPEGVLRGEVRGTRAQPYRVYVHVTGPDEHGELRPVVARCSCPVRSDCKHAAAVLLKVRTATAVATRPDATRHETNRDQTNRDQTSRHLPAATPGWRDRADAAVRALDREPRHRHGHPHGYGRPAADDDARVGLQIMLRPPEPAEALPRGPVNRAEARVVKQTRTGRWTATGLSWESLGSQWTSGVPARTRPWFVAVLAAARAGRPAEFSRTWIDLTHAPGPVLASLLGSAAASGIDLVDDDGRPIAVGPPARVVLAAGEPHDDAVEPGPPPAQADPGPSATPDSPTASPTTPPVRLEAAVVVELPDGSSDLEHSSAALVGDGHLVCLAGRDGLTLHPVADPAAALALAGWRALDIPPGALDEFCAEVLPELADRCPIADTTGLLHVPELVGVELELVVKAARGGKARLSWRWVEELGVGGGRTRSRTRALIDPTPGDRWDEDRTALVRAAQSHGLSPKPVDELLDQIAAARLLLDVVPRLRQTPGLRVHVDDDMRAVRRATSAPEIALGADDSGIDWFDLRVEITVDGRPVPVAAVLAALAAGETELLTADGVLVTLDDPRLTDLRELLADARELRPHHAPGDAGRVSVGTADTGWWSQLAALADVVDIPAGRLDALRALAADTPSQVRPPAGLDADLRDYQQRGLDWLALLWRHRLGGILADDMGLGKTVQALALIAHAHETSPPDQPTGPFLVVAPSSVAPNWAREAARFTPGLRTRLRPVTTARSDSSVADDAHAADLVVTTAAVLRADADDFAAAAWAGVICDEAQMAKNPSSKLFAALAGLRAPFFLAITGTPVENSLTDLWAIAALACPGVLSDAATFRSVYRTPVEKHGDAAAADALRRRLRPFLLRRRKEVVAAELPSRTESVLEVDLGPAHRRIYDRELTRQRAELLRLLDDLDGNRIAVLAALTRLRRLCLDPAVVDPRYEGTAAAKTDELVSAVTEVVAEGHRALVFSQFTSYLDVVTARLRAAGLRCAHLDGSTTDRAGAVAEFRDDGADVFCISLKAGGTGLTLVEADYVFLLDPWWNPATEAQAVDRAHRIGQTRPVVVYRMIARNTIEERVVDLQRRKAQLASSVLDGGEAFAAALSAEDLRSLLE